MKSDEANSLKNEIKNFFEKYGYTWCNKWWNKYRHIIEKYNKLSKREPFPTSYELKSKLNTLRDMLAENKEYFKTISRPDLFADTKDPDFEEFCKDLTFLVDCLSSLEPYTDSLSNSCPPKNPGRPEESHFKNLVNDLYTIFKELDPKHKGLTYDPHSNAYDSPYKGPLFDLVYITIQQINIDISLNTESLGKAIQRALETDSFVTTEKPFGDWKTPEEWQREKIREMSEEGLSIDDIAKELDISRSTVYRQKPK